MTEKPVVRFRGTADFWNVIDDETGLSMEVAQVCDVLDHPCFGFQRVVFTSEVLSRCEDGKSFETRNTIYKKVDDDEEQPEVAI